jgi:hypothetical protein
MPELNIGAVVGDAALTSAAHGFLRRTQADVNLLFYMYETVAKESMNAAAGKSTVGVPTLDRHVAIMEQMFFCRYIDSFLIYISDLLRNVLRKQPNILAGTEKIKTERLLKVSTIQELLDEVIEEQVASLSYAGFHDLCDWLRKRGIELCPEQHDEADLVEAIAIRNLIVHNEGRVDNRFVKLVPSRKAPIGEELQLTIDDITAAVKTIAKTVSYSDQAASKKFGLLASAYASA